MRIPPISLLAAGFLAASQAFAATTVAITTEVGNGADAHIQTGNATNRDSNFGNSTQGAVKFDGTGTYSTNTTNRKGYIRFDISTFTLAASPNVTLKLSTLGWSGSGTLQVYGLNDGNIGENWIEGDGGTGDSPVGEIDWNNAPANGGASATSNTFEAAQSTLLGSFTQGSSADGTQISFSSAALNNFLQADNNGMVTLMFLRTTSSGSINTGWANKEHATLTAPTLQFDTIPEPSVALLGGLGVLGLLRRRRN